MIHRTAPSIQVHEAHPIVAAAGGGAFAGAAGVLLLVYAAIVVISIIAAVKVVTKAGYSGWWVLIAFVPLVGVIMALVFAFSDWPVLREVRALRAQVASYSGYGTPPGYGGGVSMPGGPSGPGMPPAGWYPTPEGGQRYWDGRAWTDHFA
ncbi:MAG: DUF2510 domain-containing protein [Actinomycetota bacterium]|jgi:hypothetical protein|nr:DUF2510 domain-containing protein [Actinomycetota bacterium]